MISPASGQECAQRWHIALKNSCASRWASKNVPSRGDRATAISVIFAGDGVPRRRLRIPTPCLRHHSAPWRSRSASKPVKTMRSAGVTTGPSANVMARVPLGLARFRSAALFVRSPGRVVIRESLTRIVPNLTFAVRNISHRCYGVRLDSPNYSNNGGIIFTSPAMSFPVPPPSPDGVSLLPERDGYLAGALSLPFSAPALFSNAQTNHSHRTRPPCLDAPTIGGNDAR